MSTPFSQGWTHNANSSRHVDGHKLLFFPHREDMPEFFGWWAYPFGNRDLVRGPFSSRPHAEEACDPENLQAWRTAPIPFVS